VCNESADVYVKKVNVYRKRKSDRELHAQENRATVCSQIDSNTQKHQRLPVTVIFQCDLHGGVSLSALISFYRSLHDMCRPYLTMKLTLL
jgi:hypothetical protein